MFGSACHQAWQMGVNHSGASNVWAFPAACACEYSRYVWLFCFLPKIEVLSKTNGDIGAGTIVFVHVCLVLFSAEEEKMHAYAVKYFVDVLLFSFLRFGASLMCKFCRRLMSVNCFLSIRQCSRTHRAFIFTHEIGKMVIMYVVPDQLD